MADERTTTEQNHIDLQQVKKDVAEMKGDIRDIKLVVVGNAQLDIVGLTKRLTDIERERMQEKIRTATIAGGVSVVVALGNALFKYLSR